MCSRPGREHMSLLKRPKRAPAGQSGRLVEFLTSSITA